MSPQTPDLSQFPHLPPEKVLPVDEAFCLLSDQMTVVTAMAAGEPQQFFKTLSSRAHELKGLRVYCANPSHPYNCFNPEVELRGHLQLLVMFLTAKVSPWQGFERTHYVPQHLSQWSANLARSGTIDVFWGSCSLPDARGFVSLGLNNCYESDVFRKAKVKILEVNPNMPATLGSTTVSVRDVNAFVPSNAELPTVTRPTITEVDRRIGAHVSELITDGSTIQLGIGSIPNAIAEALHNKKHLGVHTEMINDAMMDLYQRGVIDNSQKTRWPGKMVGTFVYGTPELYKFVEQNPVVELHPASVVNDPFRIAENHKMVSLNTALEVDLTGQVCSESVGHREISGVGGAFETHFGAQRSPGGRGVVCLASQTRNGEHSKIVFELKPGAKVTISRNDLDTIVTEYGVAQLKGRSVSERTLAMIRVAHPQYRDELRHKAKQAGYL